jgi:hypothetical protein
MSSRPTRQSSAGHEEPDEDDISMALPEDTLSDLQVLACRRVRTDDKGQEMLADIISKWCADSILSIEKREVIKRSGAIKKTLTDKYNREIKTEIAKAEEEAAAKEKADAEAEAKAQAQEELSNLPCMVELEAEDNLKLAEVSFVCLILLLWFKVE